MTNVPDMTKEATELAALVIRSASPVQLIAAFLKVAYCNGRVDGISSIQAHLQAAPTYRFHLVCPECNKTTETVQSQRVPEPKLSCGDCLMDRGEIVSMKVLTVQEEKAR